MGKRIFTRETGNISCKNWHGEDRNYKDLTEAEEIKKWQETQKNFTKNVLMTGIIMMVWSLT